MYFGSLTRLSEGWKRTPWYGDIMDWNFPSIYHAEHGWQDCLERREEGYYIEDPSLGRLLISPKDYPIVIQTDTGRRLRFERGVGIVRRFQYLDSGKWLEVPRKEL